jgi:CRISPR-associated protein Cas1
MPTGNERSAGHADATAALERTFSNVGIDDGVVVVDGFGASLKVEQGHLVLADGIGRHRRERRFPRVQPDLRRVVVLARSGFVTIEALRWARDTDVEVVMAEPDGRVLASSGDFGVRDPRLRRAHAAAATSDVGLRIVVELLVAKTTGQADVCYLFPRPRPDVAETILGLADAIARAPNVDGARLAEAAAAVAYWEMWSGLGLRFVGRDLRSIPARWQTFGTRRSPLATTATPRRAATPGQAMVNFTYSIAVAECRSAALAMGLDPGLGVGLHTDMNARDSLSLDLVEVVRPHVDRYLLRLVEQRAFRRLDFAETAEGVVRINAPLSHDLAATAGTWAKIVAPWVERVAHLLAEATEGRIRSRTPLTGAGRGAGTSKRRPRREAAPRLPFPACRTCGEVLSDKRNRYCSDCGERTRARTPAAVAWEAAHPQAPSDPAWWREQVLPRLAGHKLSEIMEATKVSQTYASRLRSGERVPHPMWWSALAELVGAEHVLNVSAETTDKGE